MNEIKISGEVINGEKRGRLIGFPTANIELDEKYNNLANGVYGARIELLGRQEYKGIANIGTHPTVGHSPVKLLEVNIFDFSEDIYGEMITVTLTKFIRPEQRFSGLEELKEQIRKDINKI